MFRRGAHRIDPVDAAATMPNAGSAILSLRSLQRSKHPDRQESTLGGHLVTGSVRVTTAPRPSSFAAAPPPCARAIAWTIASPRPVPPRPRASSAREAVERVREEVRREPAPSSLTCSSTCPSPGSAWRRTVPAPCLRALSTRLPSACSNRTRSPTIGSPSGASTSRARPSAARALEPSGDGAEQSARDEIEERRSGSLPSSTRANEGPRRAGRAGRPRRRPSAALARILGRGAVAAGRARAPSGGGRAVSGSWLASATKAPLPCESPRPRASIAFRVSPSR